MVNQKRKLIELNTEFAVYDQQGTQIGAVRQVGQSAAKKALRFVSNVDQFLTHKFQVVDLQGNVLLALTRPAKLLKSRVQITDGHGQPVGEVVQQNASARSASTSRPAARRRRHQRRELAGLELRHPGPHGRRGGPHHQDVGGAGDDPLHDRRQLRRPDPPSARRAPPLASSSPAHCASTSPSSRTTAASTDAPPLKEVPQDPLPLRLSRRAARTLMFWLIVAVFAVGRRPQSSSRPSGFDEVRTGDVPLEVAGADDGVWVLNYADHSVSLVDTSRRRRSSRPSRRRRRPRPDRQRRRGLADPRRGRHDRSGRRRRAGASPTASTSPTPPRRRAPRTSPPATASSGSPPARAGQMVRLDTATGEVGEPIDLGQSVVQPQIVGDSLWVHESDGITEYDADDRRASCDQLDTARTGSTTSSPTEDAVCVIVDVGQLREDGPRSSGSTRTTTSSERRPGPHPGLAPDAHHRRRRPGLRVRERRACCTRSSHRRGRPAPRRSIASRAGDGVDQGPAGADRAGRHVWVADGTNGVVHQPIAGIEGDVTTEDTVP